jgi:hypothetical protein
MPSSVEEDIESLKASTRHLEEKINDSELY